MRTLFFIILSLLFGTALAADSEWFAPDPEQPGLYISREPITLTHVIVRPKTRELWKEKFYQEYAEAGKPPQEWFTFKDGVWHSVIKHRDLNSVTYDELFNNSSYTQLDRIKNPYIFFIANPKPEARWLNSNDPKSTALWQAWIADPKNLAKPNRFKGLKQLFDIGAKYGKPEENIIWHSAFYDEYKIAGVMMHPGTVVVRNETMFQESRLFMPRFMNLVKPQAIYYRCPGLFGGIK